MKKSAGFTLIELVIVIIILGILGAVAAPRLFNLQGDAYGANLNALKSSISTAATMANAKAQIQGKMTAPGDGTDKDVKGYENIEFVAGYPAANKIGLGDDGKAEKGAGILATLDGFETSRYDVEEVEGANPAAITITPNTATDPVNCRVTYTQAVSAVVNADDSENNTPAEPAKVTVKTDGC